MTIGIDVTPLQTPHSLRGIGSVVRNIISNLPVGDQHYILYVLDPETAQRDITPHIPKGIQYEFLQHAGSLIPDSSGDLSQQPILEKIARKFRHFTALYRSAPQLPRSERLDVYIQFDPNVTLPGLAKGTEVRLVVYDLIPYVLEKDYLWNYKTARANGYSLKASLNRSFLRKSYLKVLKNNCRKAATIFAISRHTKNDLVRYTSVDPDRVIVTHLGVSKPLEPKEQTAPAHQYIFTNWGTVTRPLSLNSSRPFMFFTGGADSRRKLKDLFAAYNNLRAQGIEVSLMLAGDTMKGLKDLPNKEARKYLLTHKSYLDNVHFLGYVTKNELAWLYANAAVFVFPSIYEGFGLPVLESAAYGTPAITYKNSSLAEIGNDGVLYAEDFIDIANKTKGVLAAKKRTQPVAPKTWGSVARTVVS